MNSAFASPAPAIERDRWGRPLLRVPSGPDAGKKVPHTRATTIAGAIDDKSGLMLWKQRLTALGLTQRRDLLTAIAAADPDDKKTINRLVEEAAEAAGSTAAATTGTALHAFTERIDTGQPVGNVPEEYRADLDAYQAAAAEAGWTVHGVEKFLVLPAYRIAGTADRVIELDGERYIADVKTGSSVAFPHSFAAQLAIYSRSLPWDHDLEATIPWDAPPNQERGLIIHIPAGQGRCDLHWIDLDAGWWAVKLAMQVREWRAQRDLLQPFTTDPLTLTIRRARLVTDLERLWADHQDTWTPQHTAEAARRKKTLGRGPAFRDPHAPAA